MKTLKPATLFFAVALFALFSSCEKVCIWSDCDDNEEKNIISKTGLPLSGSQEVPVRNTPASGTMNVSYNKITHILTYKITWDSLTANPVGSHIHGTAPKGVNAGIKHDFTALLPKTTSGSFTNSVVVDNMAIKEDSLLTGFYYINIHTPTYPGGEIRGQIEF